MYGKSDDPNAAAEGPAAAEDETGAVLPYDSTDPEMALAVIDIVDPYYESSKTEAAEGRIAFSADIIYGALGSKPQDELYRDLILSGLQLYVIGDAQSPGRIVDAIHDAYDRAVAIGV